MQGANILLRKFQGRTRGSSAASCMNLVLKSLFPSPFAQASFAVQRYNMLKLSLNSCTAFNSYVIQCEELRAVYTKAKSVEEDDEDWEDIMEEMEDFWMRDPKVSLNRLRKAFTL